MKHSFDRIYSKLAKASITALCVAWGPADANATVDFVESAIYKSIHLPAAARSSPEAVLGYMGFSIQKCRSRGSEWYECPSPNGQINEALKILAYIPEGPANAAWKLTSVLIDTRPKSGLSQARLRKKYIVGWSPSAYGDGYADGSVKSGCRLSALRNSPVAKENIEIEFIAIKEGGKCTDDLATVKISIFNNNSTVVDIPTVELK